jgi:hypothetical protein
MNQKFSNDRLLLALKRTLEGQRLNRKLYSAVEKMSKGKKLNSHEFNEVHDILYRPGPYVKYNSPEKWERVTREFSARNLITQ